MWQTILSMLATKGQQNANQTQPTIENVFKPIDLTKQGQQIWRH